MFSLDIVAHENGQITRLSSELAQKGFNCWVAPTAKEALEKVAERAPDLVLIAMDGLQADSGMRHVARRIKQEGHLPVIALFSKMALDGLDSTISIDDFVVEPWDANEVAVRAQRILWRRDGIDRGESIQCGDLVIDMGQCQVSVAGRLVVLTFKEYELLRFLASNTGQVFSRDMLLNRVWGYDYYGGDRTVDVHIRRLRSKIEDPTHTFIETVRNIGYRFKSD